MPKVFLLPPRHAIMSRKRRQTSPPAPAGLRHNREHRPRPVNLNRPMTFQTRGCSKEPSLWQYFLWEKGQKADALPKPFLRKKIGASFPTRQTRYKDIPVSLLNILFPKSPCFS